MAGPLLLDVSCICDAHTDEALELLAKAGGEDPPDIWEPHPNPFVRRIVELFTERGLTRIGAVRAELERWLAGQMERPSFTAPDRRPSPGMVRWEEAERGLVRLYLQNLPSSTFVLEDWMLLVDYLAQKYLPADALIPGGGLAGESLRHHGPRPGRHGADRGRARRYPPGGLAVDPPPPSAPSRTR
jgi:hypothetical protein